MTLFRTRGAWPRGPGHRLPALRDGHHVAQAGHPVRRPGARGVRREHPPHRRLPHVRSEEHTSELQSLMTIPYAVLFLTKKIMLSHIIPLISLFFFTLLITI